MDPLETFQVPQKVRLSSILFRKVSTGGQDSVVRELERYQIVQVVSSIVGHALVKRSFFPRESLYGSHCY